MSFLFHILICLFYTGYYTSMIGIRYNDFMQDIYLVNSLGHKKQLLVPIKDGYVSVYHCGPTVYWTQHIGNMRAAFFGDIVNRTLNYAGYDVTFVRNYTDVGHLSGDNDGDADTGIDRMEKASVREQLDPVVIADKYRTQFDLDLEKLQVRTPTYRPSATEYIQSMISLTKELLDKKYAYQTPLAIYFDTSTQGDYGKLSGHKIESQEHGSGHGTIVDTQKKHATDFALWFFKTGSHEHALQTWDNPFSDIPGFPGWHIECSVMIREILGPTIDIHLGGIEHIPIHHTNEIAQSESAHGVSLAQYWLHNEHLEVDGGKMSKSDGTSYSISDLESRGFSAFDLRYFFLQAHYRSKQNFTYEALDAARTGCERLLDRVSTMPEGGSVNDEMKNEFEAILYDDFNTAGALAVVASVLKSRIDEADKRATILDFDRVLGLKLDQRREKIEISDAVQSLVRKRQIARDEKKWEETDQLRDTILKMGYVVTDGPNGQKIEKKK